VSLLRHALFPGTFDPVTLGHLDIVRRAQALFGRVTVAVATNPEKHSLFDVEERLELLRLATAGLPGVAVVGFAGLVVDACRELGAEVVVRGVRSGTDCDYELQMARTNRAMAPSVETVLLVPAPEHAHISSTLVRQIASLGGDASAFVPPPVAERLARRYPRAAARAEDAARGRGSHQRAEKNR
jgi:pantetheine-phosphate adenylyltransferase